MDMVGNELKLIKTYWSYRNESESTDKFCLLKYNEDEKVAAICSDDKNRNW